jgi:hypothetical protein
MNPTHKKPALGGFRETILYNAISGYEAADSKIFPSSRW